MTATFAAETNPLSTTGIRAAYSPALTRIVAIGNGTTAKIATSDDNGVTWVGRNNVAIPSDIVWGDAAAMFVARTSTQLARSPDGITWTFQTVAGFSPRGVAWNGTIFVAVGSGLTNTVFTSPDGITWTGQGAPSSFNYVAWSPTLALWVAVPLFFGQAWTSPNASVWTSHVQPIPNAQSVRWLPQAAKFVITGQDGGGTHSLASSTNGTAWTALPANPFGANSVVNDICELNNIWYIGGTNASGSQKILQSSDQGTTWTASLTAMDGESSAHEVFGLLAIPGPNVIIALSDSGIGATIMVGAEAFVPVLPRFYEGFDWRWIVTDTSGATLTFLDPLAMNRQITFNLNEAAVATCDLPSDNPEVNITQGGVPFVSFNDKLLFCFRREQPTAPLDKWVCRFAGVIEQLNDEIAASSDAPVTHLTAWDPWHYLDSRPVIDNKSVKLPGQGGVTYPANGVWTPALIIVDLLKQTIAYNLAEGIPGPFAAGRCYIDFETGHVPSNTTDDTAPIIENINFQQGMSVGDAFRQVVSDGLCDIVMTPKYPIQPDSHLLGAGGIVQLNVYAFAGSVQFPSVFAWDKPSDNLVGVNRLEDGSTMGNHVALFAGAAGVPVAAPPNGASVQRYGPYWYLDSLTGKLAYIGVVQVLAQAQVLQRAYGQPTITIDPAPERAPIPLMEYNVGDRVPLYVSTRFREAINPVQNGNSWDGLGRIWSIPILIPDDAPEQVVGLQLQVFPVIPQPVQPSMINVVAPTQSAARTLRRHPMSKLKPPFTG